MPDTENGAAADASSEGRGLTPRRARVIATMGLPILAIITVVVVLATTPESQAPPPSTGTDAPATTVPADASATEDWPTGVGGKPPALGERGAPVPSVAPVGVDAGVYVWNDFDGWHLWVVNDGAQPITGTITSNDQIARADLAAPGAGESTIEGTTVTFSLPADPPVVGIDLNPGFFAKELRIDLQHPDGPVPADRIHLGGDAALAPQPFEIAKVPS